MAKNTDINKLTPKIDVNIETFYNIYNVLSYDAFINVIMGGRGIGKTTQFLIWFIKRLRDYGEEFIYLRRYKTQTSSQNHLLDKIVDNVTFVGNKNGGGTYKWNGITLGYCIALSTAHNFKSVNFDKVRYILYDEAIIRQNSVDRYLKNEVFCLLEFISTVFRLRTNGKVFIVGNNLDYFNPYCEYFKIKVINNIYYDKQRSILIEYAKDSAKLREIEENTPLYNLTKGTPYHDYHYNNTVIANQYVKSVNKLSTDKLRLRLVINNYTLNLYIRSNGNLLAEHKSKVIIEENRSLVLMSNNEINYYYANILKSTWLNYIKEKYYTNGIEYTSQDANKLMEIVMDMF